MKMVKPEFSKNILNKKTTLFKIELTKSEEFFTKKKFGFSNPICQKLMLHVAHENAVRDILLHNLPHSVTHQSKKL
jgi:hypothetical protein